MLELFLQVDCILHILRRFIPNEVTGDVSGTESADFSNIVPNQSFGQIIRHAGIEGGLILIGKDVVEEAERHGAVYYRQVELLSDLPQLNHARSGS